MSEESVESIFQHACEGAAESIGHTRENWQQVVYAIRELRRERDESRRLLDEALAQEPVAYLHNKRADVIHTSVKSLLSDFAVNYGPESMLRPIDKSEHYTIPLYAAPVPAQPAVPEAVAKDSLLCELLPVLDEVMAGGVAEDLLSRLDGGQSINTVEGIAWLKLRAILSATDTEVKK